MKVSVFCALRCVFFAGFEGKRGAARGKKHWFFPLVLLGQMSAAGALTIRASRAVKRSSNKMFLKESALSER